MTLSASLRLDSLRSLGSALAQRDPIAPGGSAAAPPEIPPAGNVRALREQERRDMLEIFEDRHGARSTIVTSQLPVETWHDYVADPTIADALLDRIVHVAHRIKLKGPSRRKLET